MLGYAKARGRRRLLLQDEDNGWECLQGVHWALHNQIKLAPKVGTDHAYERAHSRPDPHADETHIG